MIRTDNETDIGDDTPVTCLKCKQLGHFPLTCEEAKKATMTTEKELLPCMTEQCPFNHRGTFDGCLLDDNEIDSYFGECPKRTTTRTDKEAEICSWVEGKCTAWRLQEENQKLRTELDKAAKQPDYYERLVTEREAKYALELELTELRTRNDKAVELLGKAVKAASYLLNFVPGWAKEVPKGLDPTLYGTGSYERDLVVKEGVEKAAAVIAKIDELLKGGE